jgi:hypothetical protein
MRIAVLLFSVLGAISVMAQSTVPQIADVPDATPERERTPLLLVREKLVQMRDTLRVQSAEHNAKCQNVNPADAVASQRCLDSQQKFVNERENYARVVARFNERANAFRGEKLDKSKEKWEGAISQKRFQNAFLKTVDAAAARGDISMQRSSGIKGSISGDPMFIAGDGGNEPVIAVPIEVLGPKKEVIVRSFIFSPLKEGETAESAAIGILDTMLFARQYMKALDDNPR